MANLNTFDFVVIFLLSNVVQNAIIGNGDSRTLTTIIRDGKMLTEALRRLVLRPGEIEHALRLQNGDDVSDVAVGRLGPDGQLVIELKPSEQNATHADVHRLETRLAAIEDLLAVLAEAPGYGSRAR